MLLYLHKRETFGSLATRFVVGTRTSRRDVRSPRVALSIPLRTSNSHLVVSSAVRVHADTSIGTASCDNVVSPGTQERR
jgi:hypothetical protein